MSDPTTIIGTELAKILLKWIFDQNISKLDGKRITNDDNKKFEEATQKYIDNYRHNHGKVSVLGMAQPKELETIFTKVQLIKGRNSWRYIPLDAQQKAYLDKNQRSLFDRCDTQEGVEIANENQYLMVLGQPGAGKSTFLKRIGLALLQDQEERVKYRIRQNLPGLEFDNTSKDFYQHELFPVMVELKRCISSKIDLVGKIQSELEICGFKSSEKLTKMLLEQGRILVLLDGLDEIPDQYFDKAITQIQDFVNQYHQNRFIISCRTAAYKGGFSNLVNVEMADFDDEQIQQFITNWFSQEKDQEMGVAKKCWELLNNQDYQATKELAHTPLLLTFLCLVYDDSQAFPKNRAELYKDALDILMRKWASEKRIHRDPIYKDLTLRLEEMMLAKIAYQQFSKDRLFFDEGTVITEIREYLAENLNAPKHLDGGDVLKSIQTQQGILVARSRNILSFSHLTLQEYLTAQYIVDRSLINELVEQHLNSTRWREVFLLVSGLMRGGADSLLEKMAIISYQLINTDNLRSLVAWAEERTRSNIGQSPMQRHMALWIANTIVTANAITNNSVDTNVYTEAYSKAYSNANAYAYTNSETDADAYIKTYAKAYTYANAFINAYADITSRSNIIAGINATKLIQSIAELHIFNHINYQEIRDEIQPSQDHLSTWCKSLGLKLNWLKLSPAEINNLQYYFNANLMIMRCKYAAIDISNTGWAAVEEKMFRVLNNDN